MINLYFEGDVVRGSPSERNDRVIQQLVRIVKSQSRNLSTEDAHDIVFEKIPSLASSAAKVDDQTLKTYVYRTLNNRVIDLHRSNAHRKHDSLEEIYLVPASTDEDIGNSSSDSILRVLDKLPIEYQQVIELVDINDLSHEEAANALQITIGALKSRLFRARTRMRQLMSDPRDECELPTGDIKVVPLQARGNSKDSEIKEAYDSRLALEKKCRLAWRNFQKIGLTEKNIADFLRGSRMFIGSPFLSSLKVQALPKEISNVKKLVEYSCSEEMIHRIPQKGLLAIISIDEAIRAGRIVPFGKLNRLVPHSDVVAFFDMRVDAGKPKAGTIRRIYRKHTNPFEISKILQKKQLPFSVIFKGFDAWKEEKSRIDLYLKASRGRSAQRVVDKAHVVKFLSTGECPREGIYSVLKFADFMRLIELRQLLFFHPEKKFYSVEDLKIKYPFRRKFSPIFLRMGPSRLEQLRHLGAERLKAKKGEGESLPLEPKDKYIQRMRPYLLSALMSGLKTAESIADDFVAKNIPNQRGVFHWTAIQVARLAHELQKKERLIISETPGINHSRSVQSSHPNRTAHKAPLEILSDNPSYYFLDLIRLPQSRNWRLAQGARKLFDQPTYWKSNSPDRNSFFTLIFRQPTEFSWDDGENHAHLHFAQGTLLVIYNHHGTISWNEIDPQNVEQVLSNISTTHNALPWRGLSLPEHHSAF